MTLIEKALIATLYALYLYDCVYWVAPAERGFTRATADVWKRWQIEPLSFILLNRRPVLSSPLLLHPGFVRTAVTNDEATDRKLRLVARRLNSLHMLLTLCRLQAFLLLVYLPAIIVLHRLSSLGLTFACILLPVHILLSTLAIRALRRARPAAWLTPATSLALNPLGATRAFDTLAEAYFSQEPSRRKAVLSTEADPPSTLRP